MKYYNSIQNLPIALYEQIQESSNINLLIIDNNKVDVDVLVRAWEIISNEIIKHFGISNNYKAYISHLQEALNNYAMYVKTNDKMHITMAQINVVLAQKQNVKQDGNLFDNCAKLSKHYGFRINPQEITVMEYYSYINNME